MTTITPDPRFRMYCHPYLIVITGILLLLTVIPPVLDGPPATATGGWVVWSIITEPSNTDSHPQR